MREVKGMQIHEQLNAAVRYVEDNLCGNIDPEEMGRRACVHPDSFLRFFSYMTGMSLSEYVRRRRLTLAGYELQRSEARVIDIAMKYGYDSADAFSRAFARQHGMTPAAARRGGALNVYPPASFHITIKGASEMHFRWVDLPEKTIYGVSRAFEEEEFATREALRSSMWDEKCADVPGQICQGRWNAPGNHAYDGEWYGLWRDGRYMIGRTREHVKPGVPEVQALEPGRYAAFTTGRGGRAWEELPKLFDQVYDAWLPDSGYALRGGDIIEVYHLWTDRETRARNRFYELWIPVTPQ